jgi:hypothetical protein
MLKHSKATRLQDEGDSDIQSARLSVDVTDTLSRCTAAAWVRQEQPRTLGWNSAFSKYNNTI